MFAISIGPVNDCHSRNNPEDYWALGLQTFKLVKKDISFSLVLLVANHRTARHNASARVFDWKVCSAKQWNRL